MSIFKQIIDKKIPAQIIFEDEKCLVFKDISPQAPFHALAIPKAEINSMADVRPKDLELLGHLLLKCSEVAKSEGLSEDGYRIVINTNENGGQTVPHLHFHILGGRQMSWPPG